MSKDTGGAAFPMLGNVGYNTEWQIDEGMTLRDYFAAKALQGAISAMDSAERNYSNPGVVAENAYMLADAMIAERYKVKSP